MKPYSYARVSRAKGAMAMGMSAKAVSAVTGINVKTLLTWKNGLRNADVPIDRKFMERMKSLVLSGGENVDLVSNRTRCQDRPVYSLADRPAPESHSHG